jgi:multidrug transporter EmrE-like cation transporter
MLGGVPIAAIALVLASSIFHVAWNTLVKTSGDPLATSTRAVGLGVLAATPLVALAWLATGRPTLSPEGWAVAVASGIVSAVYFVPLSAAYRRGALSSVYPVARGSGALLGVVAGVAILGERLQPLGFLGVVLLLGGTLTAALATASRSTVAPALLAGCAVAGYSALDRVGVRTGPAWLYAWALWTVCAVGLLGWRAVAARVLPRLPGNDSATASGDPPLGVSTSRSLAAGLLIIGTYMLILLAFQIAPLAASRRCGRRPRSWPRPGRDRARSAIVRACGWGRPRPWQPGRSSSPRAADGGAAGPQEGDAPGAGSAGARFGRAIA